MNRWIPPARQWAALAWDKRPRWHDFLFVVVLAAVLTIVVSVPLRVASLISLALLLVEPWAAAWWAWARTEIRSPQRGAGP